MLRPDCSTAIETGPPPITLESVVETTSPLPLPPSLKVISARPLLMIREGDVVHDGISRLRVEVANGDDRALFGPVRCAAYADGGVSPGASLYVREAFRREPHSLLVYVELVRIDAEVVLRLMNPFAPTANGTRSETSTLGFRGDVVLSVEVLAELAEVQPEGVQSALGLVAALGGAGGQRPTDECGCTNRLST